ncbi:NIF3-like protein 1 isoform X1 [Ischnura elegans]|uniref:NIF3-like protein 1 isoform X1 n=1 Tax=Ischnura elegans TaxID=197161 RepID=UPI001ED8A8FD|nr:NIF3-like protein 1 isoform X1 [Ischnura elegans]
MIVAVAALTKALTRTSSLANLTAPLIRYPQIASLLLRRLPSKMTMEFEIMKKFCSTDDGREGLPIREVVKKLESWAPLHLAGSWDKVGLQVEPSGDSHIVSRILLTNDLTEAVVGEAVERGPFGMILSYHPPIFRPLKSLTNRTWKERVITTCIENRIAVYSPHTAWDAVAGGVNDWLASAFVTEKVVPLVVSKTWTQPNPEEAKLTHHVDIVVPNTDEQLGSFIELLTECAEEMGTQIHDLRDASDGTKVITFVCDEEHVSRLVKCVNSWPMKPLHLQFRINKLTQIPLPDFGEGRLCTLKEQLTLKEVVDAVKSHLHLHHVRLAVAKNHSLGSLVRSVALCAGSGASVLAGVDADVLLTGEMGHHDILEAVHRGSHVILCDHSNTERGFLHHLVEDKVLDNLFDGLIEVVMSTHDKEPLHVL